MDNSEAQSDEILALQSIFDETQIHISNSGQKLIGCIYVKPELNEKLTVKVEKDGAVQQLTVAHLLPIELHFNIPSDYPSVSPPEYTLVCKWLKRDQLSKLCAGLDEKWEFFKGQAILFEWVQFLQYEALQYLKIEECLDLTWAYLRPKTRTASVSNELCQSPATCVVKSAAVLDPRAVTDNQFKGDLLENFKDYEQACEKVIFDRSTHTCKVCFDEKLGSLCTQFPTCRHVFCQQCMHTFFEIRIRDGQVNELTCPEDECKSQASPGQVKDLVNSEMFARYDSLLLESTIASMLNITYCPRKQCQYPISYDPESNLVSCPYCNFHFCLMCKATYHGVAPCKMTAEEKTKLFETYMNGDSATKESMDRRYGKKQLEAMINEIQAEAWIGQNSKPCPHCNAPIEKKDGCNKMSCPRCGTYFCWLCLMQLDVKYPYLHFSSSNARCNLFEGIVHDDDDDDDDDGQADGWVNINAGNDDDFSEDEQEFINML